MTRPALPCTILLLIFVSLSAADDEKNAHKQINKITAMASDVTGRRMVSMTLTDRLKIPRWLLVQQRRQMNMNYGTLFLAHLLCKAGAKMESISAELDRGKSIYQIADALHADWKQIAAQGKAVNREVEERLYQHFLHSKPDLDRDEAEQYDLRRDGVPADNDVSDKDLIEAQNVYSFWYQQASATQGRDGYLDISKQQAARRDNVRLGGPTRGSSGGLPPAAGGLPTQ